MSLNGIDISNWQQGIDLSKVPCDFVIAKATQGTGYVSPDCARQIEQARQTGKRFGVYHYVSGGNAVAEANYFVDNCANWVGKGLFCIDWESNENSAWGNEGYLEQVIAQVKARTGIPPIIYVQASRYAQVAAVANRQNCGLWIAQYADMNATGYQDAPWNEGAYDCVIRQYSSSGRLPGYGGNLDLNKFYGDGSVYDAYVTGGGSGSTAAPSQPSDPLAGRSDDDLANAVIRGEFGDGDGRKAEAWRALRRRSGFGESEARQAGILRPDLHSSAWRHPIRHCRQARRGSVPDHRIPFRQPEPDLSRRGVGHRRCGGANPVCRHGLYGAVRRHIERHRREVWHDLSVFGREKRHCKPESDLSRTSPAHLGGI